MLGAVNIDWKKQEIDRAFDLANMVFGAALGAYVGVVVATTGIPVGKVWWLTLGLVGLSMMLNGVRTIAHLLRGTHSGPVWAAIVSAVGGLASASGGTAQSGFRFDIAAALGVGWMGTLLLFLVPTVLRKVYD